MYAGLLLFFLFGFPKEASSRRELGSTLVWPPSSSKRLVVRGARFGACRTSCQCFSRPFHLNVRAGASTGLLLCPDPIALADIDEGSHRLQQLAHHSSASRSASLASSPFFPILYSLSTSLAMVQSWNPCFFCCKLGSCVCGRCKEVEFPARSSA